MNRDVGILDESRQKTNQHGAGLRFFELLNQDRYGSGRSYLAQIETADAVGNSKQVAVGSGLIA